MGEYTPLGYHLFCCWLYVLYQATWFPPTNSFSLSDHFISIMRFLANPRLVCKPFANIVCTVGCALMCRLWHCCASCVSSGTVCKYSFEINILIWMIWQCRYFCLLADSCLLCCDFQTSFLQLLVRESFFTRDNRSHVIYTNKYLFLSN